MARRTEAFLTADIGAGSLRVAAVSPRGRILALESRPLAIDEPRPGWAEADPALWWRAFGEALGNLLARRRDIAPLAIGLTGMTRSQVFLDRSGHSLRPAILWRDGRAEGEARAIAAQVPISNPAIAVNAFHPLARLAWLVEAEPAMFAATATVLEPKDELNRRLCGVATADAITAARFDDLPEPSSASGPLARALSLLALPRAMPWSIIGTVSAAGEPFAALRGCPVVAGAMDTWAGAIGAGVARPGRAYDVAGTSEAAGLVTAGPARTDGLVRLPWTEVAHQLGGPTQAGGDAARWAHETFRMTGSLSAAVARAGRAGITASSPLFLPYLAGERAPVWRSDVRGAFGGLDRAQGADDLLLAVLEGVAHAVRDILGAAADAAGTPLEEIRVTGGGARSDAWCQVKADVLGRPVLRMREIETGLVGAACACAVALGLQPDLATAADAMSAVGRAFEPDPAKADLFRERAARYDALKVQVLDETDR